KVISNNFQGAYNATEFLAKQGCKNIAHIANAKQLSITEDRKKGYEKALLDNGLEVDESMIKYCEHGGDIKEEVESAIEDLLNREHKPDGIFVASDRLSIGCLTAIKKHSHGVSPLIAGFSNSDVVSLLKPSISSVMQPAFEMGRKAAELLIDIIESKYPIETFETFVLETEFKINQ